MNIASFLQRAGDTMAGTIDMNSNSIIRVGTLSGGTYARSADVIVGGPASSVDRNLPRFAGTTGNYLSDSSVSADNVVSNNSSGLGGNVPFCFSKGHWR